MIRNTSCENPMPSSSRCSFYAMRLPGLISMRFALNEGNARPCWATPLHTDSLLLSRTQACHLHRGLQSF